MADRDTSVLIRLMPAVFVLIWATGFIVARYGMPHAPPFTFLLVRFLLSIGCFLIWITIARVRSDLPRTIEEPIVQRLEIEGLPILIFGARAPAMTREELSWFVDDTVIRALQGVRGVSQVTVVRRRASSSSRGQPSSMASRCVSR